ncbi:peptidase U32 family protein [Gracilibacillus suaedae]|uniref:peptidase U32 family protein n=1 Tax=Gracilibacillus suaedae TaxID=2820273 RepID=UPI001ABDA28F|nr:peptidase U32 family protein [Gracilibacillus suaedae]
MTEIVSYARNVDEATQLVEVANVDAIICGEERFGLRSIGNICFEEILKINHFLKRRSKKLYVLVNAIFHDERLEEVTNYVEKLSDLSVDGIICGDPSIFTILQEKNIQIPIHWNPETLATNHETLKFWQDIGVTRAVLSNELSLDEIIDINQSLAIPIEVQVHGMTCIFQSKRKLVRNYYQKIDDDWNPEKIRYVKQTKSDQTHYPIFEDRNGTHIMSTEDICMLRYLPQLLDNRINCLRIYNIFKTINYNVQVSRVYKEAIKSYSDDPNQFHQLIGGWEQQILSIQPSKRKLGTGFYFKEQIY